MKRYALAIVIVSLLSSGPLAAAEFSGYLVATTDYVYRGATQSDGHGAVQAGLDVNFDAGWFLGAWASTVDIPGPGDNHRRDDAALARVGLVAGERGAAGLCPFVIV